MKMAEIKILWVSDLILDMHLHRTAQLGIIRSLAKKGHHIILVGMRSRGTFELRNNPADRYLEPPKLFLVPIRKLPLISAAMYAVVLTFLIPMFILSFNPDFVIMDTGIIAFSSIPSKIISKFRRTKFVLDIRSVPVGPPDFSGALYKFLFNVSVLIAKKMFSGITIVTSMMKEEMCAKFSINPSRVGVWTNGSSTTLFDPDACRIQGNELKAKLGLSGKFVVFYHGSLTSTRGITETIEATKIIAKKYSEVVLFLLGSGPFASDLKSSIKQENIQNIIIHDAVDYEQVPNFISMCDVCIVPMPDYPYWRSQSPLKVLDYLSMEKTVIATDLPCNRSVLGNQECGIYLSSAKPEVIAKAIEFAVVNKDKLCDWGKVGRTVILRNYTWQKVAEDLLSYLMSIT